MKTLTVAEFKSRFSEVIEWVKSGEEITVTYGRAKKIVGYFLLRESKKNMRKLGLYDNMSDYRMSEKFKETTEDEFPLSNYT